MDLGKFESLVRESCNKLATPANNHAVAMMRRQIEQEHTDLVTALERVLRAIEWAYTEDRLTPEQMADVIRAALAKAKE